MVTLPLGQLKTFSMPLEVTRVAATRKAYALATWQSLGSTWKGCGDSASFRDSNTAMWKDKDGEESGLTQPELNHE